MIRELTTKGAADVSGGGGAAVVQLIAVAGGAFIGYRQGGWSGAVVGAMFGYAAALTGTMAVATTGFTRLGWSVRSFAFTIAPSGMETSKPNSP